jgi:hypothetical protein
MVKHIDCEHLFIRDEDNVMTYFCLKARNYLDWEKIDEDINCEGYKALWVSKRSK